MSHTWSICPSVSTTVCSHLPTEALLVLSHHLRRHEGRCSRRAGQQRVRTLKLVAHAKVCDLDVTVVSQQQVGGLDVPVDDLVVVHCVWQQEGDDKLNEAANI